MRKITSRSLIYHTTNTHCVAGNVMSKIRMLWAFSPTTRRVLVVSNIGHREVVLRVEEQFSCIHHFGVASISIYLIATEVWNNLVGCGMECQRTAANRRGSNRGQHYLHPIESSCNSKHRWPISYNSRVVGDSERDPLHLELIYLVIGEAATMQHTISSTNHTSPSSPIDWSTHTTLNTQSSIKRRCPAPSDLSLPLKDLNAFLTVYL